MLGAEIVLLLALAQQPRTVALIFPDRREVISVVMAEKEHAKLTKVKHHTDQQARRYAALVQALGVRSSLTEHQACATLHPDRHQPLCETIRGRRLPLQRSDP